MNNKDLNWFNNLVDASYDNLDDSKKTEAAPSGNNSLGENKWEKQQVQLQY